MYTRVRCWALSTNLHIKKYQLVVFCKNSISLFIIIKYWDIRVLELAT